MKRVYLGLFAVAIAIGMSAFTAPKQRTTDGPYWFALNPDGTAIPTSTLPPNSDAGFNCLTGTTPCAASYSDITTNGSGEYVPNSSAQTVETKTP